MCLNQLAIRFQLAGIRDAKTCNSNHPCEHASDRRFPFEPIRLAVRREPERPGEHFPQQLTSVLDALVRSARQSYAPVWQESARMAR
jgi:hypothetical protein